MSRAARKYQEKLFSEAERLKAKQTRVERMSDGLWKRLWRLGFDPSYVLEMARDDIPTMVRRRVRVCPDYPAPVAKEAEGVTLVSVKNGVVLSKGLGDQNRRIVAVSGDSWVFGLFIGLLQRQVREGTEATKGKCYAMLTTLEFDDWWDVRMDNWTTELLKKRPYNWRAHE